MTGDAFAAGIARIQANFGETYSKEKLQALYESISDAGWTAERFALVCKWFLRNRRFPAWTIADWFDYKIELHNYGWACAQWQLRAPVVAWKIAEGVFGYTDNTVDLPFERA